MIILDASVLIAHLDSDDLHHARAVASLEAAVDEVWACSPLTRAEVLAGPARAGRLRVAESVLRDLSVGTVALAEDAPARLATLRAETGLRLSDCCVLLAAETVGGSVLTFDDRLAAGAAECGLNLVERD